MAVRIRRIVLWGGAVPAFLAAVQCFVADLGLKQGTATTDLSVLDTAESAVTGAGSIDRGHETMDPWRHPNIAVEPGRPALRGAAAAPGVLLPFLSPGSDDKDPPCGQLPHQAQQPGPSRGAP